MGCTGLPVDTNGKPLWCTDTRHPDAWLSIKPQVLHRRKDTSRIELQIWKPAVILSDDESNTRIGNRTYQELDGWVWKLWGGILSDSHRKHPAYTEWLSHFISGNYCFGSVHAWVAWYITEDFRDANMSLGVPGYVFMCHGVPAYAPSSLFDGPDSKAWSDSSILLDGMKCWPKFRINKAHRVVENICPRNAMPRRVWDICANKVVPWTEHLDDSDVVPISHAWVHWEEREFVTTMVNHHLWPIPLPRGVHLKGIRDELIQHNIRYAWLDVLCLRQEAQPYSVPPVRFYEDDYFLQAEKRRIEEWAADIPTIGSVYAASKQVFVYFSGLGRPFNAAQNWQDVRNWLNRAWTLQETKNPQNMIVGGMQGVPVDPWTCQASTCTLTLGPGWTVESLRN